MTLRAFHGNQEIKDKYPARVRARRVVSDKLVALIREATP